MIQDIHPHLFNNTYVSTSAIQDHDYVFSFKDNLLWLKQKGDIFEIPQKKELQGCPAEGIFLFTLNGTNCFLLWNGLEQESEQLVQHEVKSFRTLDQKELDWSIAVAFQLNTWYAHHKYCGKCGGATVHKIDERALVCPSCQSILYPSISPAIIVAIFSGDKILLARGVHFRDNMFSLVAGYVDIGESIEEAVRREVKEEVGIDIKNIRYYKSQPWPFSGSMMIGFTAEADDSQPICIDKTEIAEAGWFTRTNLPNYPQNRSIAGEIINLFVDGEL